MEQNKLTRPIEVIETEINFYKQQTATGIIEIGKRLIEAKGQLEHGQWGKWLEEKVDFSDRTATRFMRVAKELSNQTSLTDLNQSKLFLLLDVPSEQREEFIANNPVEDMTTRKLQEEIKKLKEDLAIKPTTVEVKTVVEKVVDNTDYTTINELNSKLEKINSQLTKKDTDIGFLKREKENLEQKVKLNEEDAKKYNDLKSEIAYLTKDKADLARQIEAVTSISELVVDIDNLIKTKLAPIKYSKAILETQNDEIVINNLTSIINIVESWCEEMKELLPNNTNDVIYMEV